MPKPTVASVHETQTTGGGGLPTGFIGGVTAARYGLFQYNNRPELGWQIGAELTITPDPDADQTQEALQWVEAGPFVARYKVAKLGPVMPCNDLDSLMPAGDWEDAEEGYAFFDRVFKGEEAIDDPEKYAGRYLLSFSPLPRDSKFVEFRDKAKEAGISPDVFGEDIEALVGPLYGRWDRLPSKERKGLKKDDAKKFPDEILLLTEVMPNPWTGKKAAGKKGTGAAAGVKAGSGMGASAKAGASAASKAKATAAAAKAQEAEEAEEGDSDEIDEFDIQLIANAGEALALAGGSMPVGRLAVKVSKMGYKGSEVSKVLTRLQQAEFYESELAQATMTFDPKTKTVSAAE